MLDFYVAGVVPQGDVAHGIGLSALPTKLLWGICES